MQRRFSCFYEDMKLIYPVEEHKVEFKVTVKARLRLQLYHQKSVPTTALHGDGARNSLSVA